MSPECIHTPTAGENPDDGNITPDSGASGDEGHRQENPPAADEEEIFNPMWPGNLGAEAGNPVKTATPWPKSE
ncbi:hypothetical protein KGQ71_02710 [Patescibacteria group bacterium]|nr:hypothetical protein [Patescibacteria group bacterium]